MMGWQWHQLDHIQITCISLQTDNRANTSPLSVFTGHILSMMPNQQCQSAKDIKAHFRPHRSSPAPKKCEKKLLK